VVLKPRFPGYPPDAPLLFIGHYSLAIEPAPLLPNLGVTVGRGLAAYCWDGEQTAGTQAFVRLPRMKDPV
jgi:hypothetical protein